MIEVDAVELLIVQHQGIRRLLDALEPAATHTDIDAALANMADAVALHLVIEERLLYRAISARGVSDFQGHVEDGHLMLKRRLVDVMQRDPAHGIFARKVGELRRELLLHFEEEERTVFVRAKALLLPEELGALGGQIEAATRDLSDGDPRRELLAEPAVSAPIQ